MQDAPAPASVSAKVPLNSDANPRRPGIARGYQIDADARIPAAPRMSGRGDGGPFERDGCARTTPGTFGFDAPPIALEGTTVARPLVCEDFSALRAVYERKR